MPESFTPVTYVDGETIITAEALNAHQAETVRLEGAKQDKEEGKGLSDENYSSAEKTKLAGIEAGAQVNPGAATQQAAGLMSSTDKAKLDGVEAGAQVNPGAATQQAAGLMSSTDKAKLDGVEAGAQVNPGAATQQAAGLMSSTDKAKLDGVEAGAQVNPGAATQQAAGLMSAADKAKLDGLDETLGITGATAGQYVEITSVDANGKPTGYAAATPSGAAALNAGAHNGVYRGQYLGSSVTAAQWAAISAGTFEDLYIGDYWTINGVNWRIAAFDYWLRAGDTECTAHHVVIVPDTALYDAKMNDSNIVTGAYVGSKMYTTNLATAKTTINNAFGSAHILNHREYLKNAVTGNYETAGAWYDSTVELMTEQMAYGGKIFANAMQAGNWAQQHTTDKCQLPLFALDPSKITIRAHWWLRDVASSPGFCNVHSAGYADAANASNSLGVRPAFGIVA